MAVGGCHRIHAVGSFPHVFDIIQPRNLVLWTQRNIGGADGKSVERPINLNRRRFFTAAYPPAFDDMLDFAGLVVDDFSPAVDSRCSRSCSGVA